MAEYKGIQFAKDYNKSFAEFKNEFASTHIFKKFLPKKREVELKKAYKIAQNGNVSTSANKSQKVKSKKDTK